MLRSLSAGRRGGLLRSAAAEPSVSNGISLLMTPLLLPGPQLHSSSADMPLVGVVNESDKQPSVLLIMPLKQQVQQAAGENCYRHCR